MNNLSAPKDFIDIFNRLYQDNNLTLNSLKQATSATNYSTVRRWLKEHNVELNSTCVPKERLIDFEQFKEDIQSMSREQICIKYNLHPVNIREICKRNNLIPPKRQHQIDVDSIIQYCTKHNKTYSEVSKALNVTEATVRNTVKKYNLQSKSGVLVDISITPDFIQDCQRLNRSVVVRKYNINNTATLLRICKRNNIDIKRSLVEEWEAQREGIIKNLPTLINLNKNSHSLLDIASEFNYSIEQLKRVFNDHNIDVKTHSYNKSKGEKDLLDFVRSLDIDAISIMKKYKNKVYELDCYIESHNIAIEYCGEYWHSTLHKNKTYHQDKFFWCRDQGIKLLTIFEHEWCFKQDIVKSIIINKLGKNTNKIYGRNTILKEVTSADAKIFFDVNHISGGIYSKHNYGLFKDNTLVCCISISKNRFKKDGAYEITRFASLLGTSVVGGFSKLLAATTHLRPLITFADLRFGDGGVYLKNNFQFIGTTKPNYWYFSTRGGSKFESRIKFQKAKLTALPAYDINKTEHQIMAESNYLQIYDCGSHKKILG